MKSQIFKDNVEDNEIRFLIPEEKDVIENKNISKERYGR